MRMGQFPLLPGDPGRPQRGWRLRGAVGHRHARQSKGLAAVPYAAGHSSRNRKAAWPQASNRSGPLRGPMALGLGAPVAGEHDRCSSSPLLEVDPAAHPQDGHLLGSGPGGNTDLVLPGLGLTHQELGVAGEVPDDHPHQLRGRVVILGYRGQLKTEGRGVPCPPSGREQSVVGAGLNATYQLSRGSKSSSFVGMWHSV